MKLRCGFEKESISRRGLLVGLVLLLVCRVAGKPVASSTDSSALNELSVDDPTTASGLQPSTVSAESHPLSNEVLPTETLVAATLRIPKSTTTDAVPELNRDQVSLALPDDLFSSTANLTLQLRNFIGHFITRTSVRIAQVVRFFQPLFGYHLMIDIPKELDV